MKLSDAIRLGAMLRPQAFRALFRDGKSCAFGAAMEAVTGFHHEHQMPMGGVSVYWPWLSKAKPLCPECGSRPADQGAANIVSEHLNDWHAWTRERIADWVETIEPREVPATQSDFGVADGMPGGMVNHVNLIGGRHG